MLIALLLTLTTPQTPKPEPIAEQFSTKGIRHGIFITGGETYILNTDGKVTWKYPVSTRDGWVRSNGSIVLAVNKTAECPGGSVVEIDPKGEPRLVYKGTQDEVDTVQPLPDGGYMLTESGTNPRLLEVDKDGKERLSFPLQCQKENHHMQTRMARKLKNGNYLAPHLLDFAVKEYDRTGKVVWTGVTPNWPFTAIRLPNGNTLAGCTRGNIVVELDKDGKIVWQLSNDDPAGKDIKDACGVQRLANGNTVVTCYGAGGEGSVKVIEVTPAKELVWSLKTGRGGTVHTFQILDKNGKPERGAVWK